MEDLDNSNVSDIPNNILYRINSLSTPAYFYFISIAVINIYSLFVTPLNCSNFGYILCLGLVLLSLCFTIVLMLLVTWVIDKIYISGYNTFAWIVAVVILFIHLEEINKMSSTKKKRRDLESDVDIDSDEKHKEKIIMKDQMVEQYEGLEETQEHFIEEYEPVPYPDTEPYE